ncbi:MAG: hypothetical protein M1470_05430 [Bacteroidetes bacterium]|nr:hypothetical protein [Bacteroidota bacterium]MCL5737286.1 hypothetical protein [Bacteroidota bacterium]
MTDSSTTYDSQTSTAKTILLHAADVVSTDLLGLISIISILILLLLSEGNILLGIIS